MRTSDCASESDKQRASAALTQERKRTCRSSKGSACVHARMLAAAHLSGNDTRRGIGAKVEEELQQCKDDEGRRWLCREAREVTARDVEEEGNRREAHHLDRAIFSTSAAMA